MKSRNRVLLISTILTCIILNIQNVMLLAKGQGESAYFTKVEHLESKIYQTNIDWWNFLVNLTVYNVNCTVDESGRAWFFLKVYKDDELWWNEYNDTTYSSWQCDVESDVERHYRFPIATWQGPNVYNFKIELYWDERGTPHLLDTISFSITCVLAVHLSYITVFSYLFIYLLATFLLLCYLLISRPYKFWTTK